MIRRDEPRPGIPVVTIAHGKANALDLELLGALAETFAELERDSPRAVVLTGTGTIFSAGVDLFRVLDGGARYVSRFVPALSATLEAIVRFSRPLVAAINGHAIAGGCVVACAAERRIMADGPGRIGVPELQVGVPFPQVALELVREWLSPATARELVYTGRRLAPDEARAAGLVDEIVPPDDLAGRALDVAETLGAIPQDTFALTRRQLRQPLLDRLAAFEEVDAEVLAVWQSDRALARIREYMDRTVRGR